MANNLHVSVWDNNGSNVEDMVEIYSNPVFVDGNPYSEGSFGFVLASGSGDTKVLNSTKLPSCLDITKFDAIGFPNYGFLQRDGSSNGGLLQFTIDSITSTQQCNNAGKHYDKKEKKDK